MTTDNRTNEQIVAEAMVDAGAPLMHSRVEEAVVAALRAAGRLAGEPTEAQLEAAAAAVFEAQGFDDWGVANRDEREDAIDIARAALVAAQGVAPVPSSGVDEVWRGRIVTASFENGVSRADCGLEDCECPEHEQPPIPAGTYVTVRLDKDERVGLADVEIRVLAGKEKNE